MVVPIDREFRDRVNQHIADAWAGPIVITKGISHDTSDCDGFISVMDGAMTGYILYLIHDFQCEIVVLQSMMENRGVASALVKAVINAAINKNCTRVWLITTNDNIHAIRYYQRFGFELTAVHINALDTSRRLKPSIPLLGIDDIPIKHEFEFSYPL